MQSDLLESEVVHAASHLVSPTQQVTGTQRTLSLLRGRAGRGEVVCVCHCRREEGGEGRSGEVVSWYFMECCVLELCVVSCSPDVYVVMCVLVWFPMLPTTKFCVHYCILTEGVARHVREISVGTGGSGRLTRPPSSMHQPLFTN